MTEELTHNPKNAVTHSIERTNHEGQPVVRKVLNGLNTSATPKEWQASDIPQHWNYWKREAQVYKSGIPDALIGSGVRLPNLIRATEQDHKIELLLQDIQGRSGTDLTFADYTTASFSWGKAQARLADADWRLPCASRGFLREYTKSKPVDYQLLYDTDAWSRPLIANNWPKHLREQLIWLYEHRATLYSIVESSPRFPTHLDFWPNNVFIDNSGELVPIDWAFYGEGALGEDIANFIPDAVFDGFVGPELLPKMEQVLFAAYLRGLREGGLCVDAKQIQKTFRACAVKYVWLGPLLLENAGAEIQRSYGGGQLDDANRQYRHRGLTLSYICAWAEKAVSA